MNTVTPEDIEKMTSEEFMAYMDNLEYTEGDPLPEENQPVEDIRTPEDIERQEINESAETPPEPEDSAREQPTATEPAPGNTPYRTFGTEQEYNQAMEDYYNKKNAPNKELLSRLRSAASPLYDPDRRLDDTQTLNTLIDDLETQGAREARIPVEQYRQQNRDAADAQAWREHQQQQQQEAQRKANAKEEFQRNILRDAQNLKAFEPDFDLQQALTNPAIQQALVQGQTLSQAYMAVKQAAQPQQPAIPKPQRSELDQNAQSAQRGTGEGNRNPATMSTKDFMAYIDRIRNG